MKSLSLIQLCNIGAIVAEGVSVEYLAAAFRMPTTTLRHRLRRYGLPTRRASILTKLQHDAISLHADGLSIRVIADRLGHTPAVIRHAIARGDSKIDKETGKERLGTLVVAPAGRFMWPTERVERLVQLLRAGVRVNEAARRMGISKNAAIGKKHRLEAQGVL